jgi:Fic family protein
MALFDLCLLDISQKIMVIELPLQVEVETKAVLRKAALAHKALAELKGLLTSIPNENILIETLTLREAKESSAIENIISTFDEVYQSHALSDVFASAAAKEVHQYAEALKKGFALVKEHDLLTNNYILQIQEVVEQNRAGFRKLPGTKLLNDITGEVVYTPPQDNDTIVALMNNLEHFINDDTMMDVDPLVKMAIIHHQFESIHPFYDGNGRTGRIINILYLVQKKLLHLPVLYLSRYIISHKNDYYRLLQQVRVNDNWEEWLLFMLTGVEQTANESVVLITSIKQLMQQYKQTIRSNFPKMYNQDLLNNLFKYPYTKIEYIQNDLHISRSTAIRHLETLVAKGLLKKQKVGRDSYYLNEALFKLLSGK